MRGKGVSEGLIMGPVYLYKKSELVIQRECDSKEQEAARYKRAVSHIKDRISQRQEKAEEENRQEAADIFQAHLEIMEDDVLEKEILEMINEGSSAAYAVQKTMDIYINELGELEDAYMAERALDIKDIKEQILYEVTGAGMPLWKKMDSPVILAAKELTPSFTAGIDPGQVLGFLTEAGGVNSHTAILARMLELPAIVGIDHLMEELGENDIIIMDGDSGEIIRNPGQHEVETYQEKKAERDEQKQLLEEFRKKETKTLDGEVIRIMANIGGIEDIEKALTYGAEGIGLFRTEFIYMNREKPPSEEEQIAIYRKALRLMGNKPVIFRTLDAGGDKPVPCLRHEEEDNPFLGCRAIRICLRQKDIFKTQIRALLQASAEGNLQVMFPMISSMHELREAKSILEECKEELLSEHTAFQEDMKVGMMIEIPAAAVMAEEFARECDFFSIGTNDLTQYTLAADRGNEAVSDLYDTHHPAVLKLIGRTIKAAGKAGIPCGICGEAAADKELVKQWVSMGVDELSMSAPVIPGIRKIICESYKKSNQRLT